MIIVESSELFLQTPDPKGAIFSQTTYSRSRGEELICQYRLQRMSDVSDEEYYVWSEDNGQTWSTPVRLSGKFCSVESRRIQLPSGQYIGGWMNPFLPDERMLFRVGRSKPDDVDSDTPEQYWPQSSMQYALSEDDGRSHGAYQSIIKEGSDFDEAHPFDGLYLGRNQVHNIHIPLFLDADTVLAPFDLSVLGEDGEILNPCHCHDYSQVVVLIGRRNGAEFAWDASRPILADPHTQSTRGLSEPTLARLDDGATLMVARGSNESKPDMPAYKWFSLSRDEGKTWSAVAPWTYDEGEAFLSPSSMCQLIRHSTGRWFWFGNIIPHNGMGNSPRYPLVAGEVNGKTGRLIRSSVRTIADRADEQSDRLQLSNFNLYEDRVTQQFVLDVPHFQPAGGKDRRGWGDAWTGDLYRYRVNVADNPKAGVR